MSNETLNLAINTSGLDEVQIKADRLLKTWQSIERIQRRKFSNALMVEASFEYLYRAGGRLRLTGAGGMPDTFWFPIEFNGSAFAWLRFKLLDMVMGEKLFEAIELRPASAPAPDPSDIWSPFLSMCAPKTEPAAAPTPDAGNTTYSFLETQHDVSMQNQSDEPHSPETPPVDVQTQILAELRKISRVIMVDAGDVSVGSGLIGATGPDLEIVVASQHR